MCPGFKGVNDLYLGSNVLMIYTWVQGVYNLYLGSKVLTIYTWVQMYL